MKNDRLFAITYILLHKNSVTAPELASELGVSIRTIYRDIDTLSANGIPIYCTQGKGGGISILGNYSIDKAMLSDTEQDQILMALQSADITGQLDLKKSISKLSGLFKKNIENWIEIDFTGWSQNNKDKEKFTAIKNSILNATLLQFTYFNNKGEESDRIVEPYKLIFKGTQWYLYAYCRTRRDYRFFKLNRMEQLDLLSESFHKTAELPLPNSYDKEHYNSTENILLTLKIHKSMAFRVYDEFKDADISVMENDLIIKANMANTPWLLHYLLGFGNTLEVLEPLTFKNMIQKEIEEMLKKYL